MYVTVIRMLKQIPNEKLMNFDFYVSDNLCNILDTDLPSHIFNSMYLLNFEF